MSVEARVHLSKAARDNYDALAALSKTVAATAKQSGLDARVIELATLRSSQLNGCAYCARVHVKRATDAGVTVDEVAQLPVWRESGVFSERERAALELAEAYVYIHRDGIPDHVYDVVGGIFSEDEYVALSWVLVSINSFNRVAIAGRYPVPPLTGDAT